LVFASFVNSSIFHNILKSILASSSSNQLAHRLMSTV
jgi:hypothetical protein